MDEKIVRNLDHEYEQFLEIMRPYLRQLNDLRLGSICSAWIERLSACKEHEKVLRNKYIVTLCYQLSKGILDEPFLKEPSNEELFPIFEPALSDISSSQVEYLVINSESVDTKVLFDKKLSTDTVDSKQNTKLERNEVRIFDTRGADLPETNGFSPCKKAIKSSSPEIVNNYKEHLSGDFGYRTSNIISKLREIKRQNTLMHFELQELKEKSKEENCVDEIIDNINASTRYMHLRNSNSNLVSLKSKLKEVQGVRNALIDKIQNLQELIDNFEDLKAQEIQEICAKHRLELINVKSCIKEEIEQIFKDKLKSQKQEYEGKIEELQNNNKKEIQIITTAKNELIAEKDKIITKKEAEILCLLEEIKDNKENLHSILKNLSEKPNENFDYVRLQNQMLEMRLVKMQRAKTKNVRAYESKLASLQREKYLLECSLQIQLARQRTEVVHDVAGECQAETRKALDKLEAKYKDIVACMQATAIQRRLEDQTAVASILQAASELRKTAFKNDQTSDQQTTF